MTISHQGPRTAHAAQIQPAIFKQKKARRILKTQVAKTCVKLGVTRRAGCRQTEASTRAIPTRLGAGAGNAAKILVASSSSTCANGQEEKAG